MKKIMFVTLIAISMSTAQAAQKMKTIRAANSNSTSTVTYSANRDTGFKFEARPGAGTSGGYFTFGMNVEGKYGFNLSGNTLFVGLETGFFRTSLYSDDFTSAGISAIPITPTATYEFAVSNKMKLYAGASVGITIGTASQTFKNNFDFGGNQGNSQTATAFTWKFRPGMVLSDTFVAELPIGTTDGTFYFMPNVGMRF